MYASQSSLCNHNKKFHSNVVTDNVTDNVTNNVTNKIKNILCKYCKKQFNHRSNKCNHEKICKFKDNVIENNINSKIDKLENIIIELKNLILQQTLDINNNNQLKIENETTKINLYIYFCY
jgi:hypothetical protein